MTESVSPFAPLSELLRAPLRKEDLEFKVDDTNFLLEFEKAWACFLRENPELVPKGAREDRILELQKDAKREEEGKLKIIKEMEQQVEFFKASCEALEDVYSGKMQAAIETQSKIHDDVQKRLEDVKTSDKLQAQTLPWHHFLYELDQIAASAKESADESEKSSRVSRPSDRAMVLTDHSKGCAGNVVLRAYKIDHALMTNHIRILTKEIERYKRMLKAQEMTGKFLKDFNAWGIVSKVQSTDESSETSLSDSNFALDY